MYNEKLQLFFKEKGLKQYEVGDILGYSPTMIGRYLKGSDKINADFIIKMIKAFPDIDLQYIFSEDETIHSAQEPKPFYGLNEMNIDMELEIIGKKVEKVREYLAQIRHNK